MDSWSMLASIVTLWVLFVLIKQSGVGRVDSHGWLEEPPDAAEPLNNREPPVNPLSQGFWVSFDKCTHPLPTRRSQQQVLNLLSERDHQLNCRLVKAALAACGLSYRSHTIVVEFVQGNLTVTMDGRRRPAQAKGRQECLDTSELSWLVLNLFYIAEWCCEAL
ncbi:hypothetical protein WJX72_011906 [[Myrmecia] bisecta]|uniref:Uncharacterized protein n=1 Tax=[Myrmecia] bisecta TaxID=41462 RepID=A0AAW1QSX7_9CHLO